MAEDDAKRPKKAARPEPAKSPAAIVPNAPSVPVKPQEPPPVEKPASERPAAVAEAKPIEPPAAKPAQAAPFIDRKTSESPQPAPVTASKPAEPNPVKPATIIEHKPVEPMPKPAPATESKPANRSEPASPPPRPALGAMAGGGLIGAVIALGLGYGALRQGLIALPPDNSVSNRMTALESRIASLPKPEKAEKPDLGLITTRIEAVEALAKDVKATAGAGEAALVAKLNERMGETDKALQEAKAVRQSLEARIKAVESLDQSDLRKKVGAAMAVDALRTRFDQNLPFADALGLAKPFLPDANAAAPLEIIAAKGLAARDVLVKEFDAPMRAMLAAVPKPDGFMARVGQSLTSIVSIRKKGEEVGESPAALVSRIETMLAKGDRKGALALYQSLPDPMKAAGAVWAKGLEAEIKADEAMRAIAAASLRALGGQP